MRADQRNRAAARASTIPRRPRGARRRLVRFLTIVASGALLLLPLDAAAAERVDAALARAAQDAAADIPFVHDGRRYVRTEDGAIVPLLDEGPAANAAQVPGMLQLAGAESAMWPDRFARDLVSAQEVAAIKAAAADRPASVNLIAWQTPIKNQGGRGTCYAFAFTAGLEAAYRHKYGRLVDGKYQGPDWILSEEYLVHVGKSTLLNRPQTYAFENPSAFWDGVVGVAGYPMMISVLSEQLMNYRVPEARDAPYLPGNNPAPRTPAGLMQIAGGACPAVGALIAKWNGAPPQLDRAGHCLKGNCATQRAVDACEYSPSHIPPNASQNARFGVAFAFKGADGRIQPGARTLTAEQTQDTDLMEALLDQGHEVVTELWLKWKRGAQIKTAFQTSPLWDYDPAAKGGGHNMLLVGYDRSDPSPGRWYFIMKNSWGGNKYYLVSYEFMRKATRGSVVIMDVVDPALDKPVSLARGGAWLGIWPVHAGAHGDLDGSLVIRRTFNPNVAVQPKAGTELRLGEFFPANDAAPREVVGYLKSDGVMVFRLASGRTGSATYTWTFGAQPVRAEN